MPKKKSLLPPEMDEWKAAAVESLQDKIIEYRIQAAESAAALERGNINAAYARLILQTEHAVHAEEEKLEHSLKERLPDAKAKDIKDVMDEIFQIADKEAEKTVEAKGFLKKELARRERSYRQGSQKSR